MSEFQERAEVGGASKMGHSPGTAMDAVVGDRLRSGNWLASVTGGAIAFPIAVLVHELAHRGIRRVPIPRSGPAVRLCQLVRLRGVRQARACGGRGGCGGDRSTVAGGGRRGRGSDRHLPDGHRLRACGPPIRPRPAFGGSRSRAGEPAALAGSDSDPRLEAPRSASASGRRTSPPIEQRRSCAMHTRGQTTPLRCHNRRSHRRPRRSDPCPPCLPGSATGARPSPPRISWSRDAALDAPAP